MCCIVLLSFGLAAVPSGDQGAVVFFLLGLVGDVCASEHGGVAVGAFDDETVSLSLDEDDGRLTEWAGLYFHLDTYSTSIPGVGAG